MGWAGEHCSMAWVRSANCLGWMRCIPASWCKCSLDCWIHDCCSLRYLSIKAEMSVLWAEAMDLVLCSKEAISSCNKCDCWQDLLWWIWSNNELCKAPLLGNTCTDPLESNLVDELVECARRLSVEPVSEHSSLQSLPQASHQSGSQELTELGSFQSQHQIQKWNWSLWWACGQWVWPWPWICTCAEGLT